MRNSRIRSDYQQKGLATCVKINLGDPRVVELAGLAGFSAAWVCQEHVPGDWSSIEHFVRAGKIHDMDLIVRVSKGSYSDYIKAFECDAAAIMVPHVTSGAEARHIVDMCRFQPVGRRALDGGNVDGAFTQLPLNDYLERSNREKLIILQIESPEGVAAVDEIAAVEGYEFILFGPGDYAHRIGKPGLIHDPEVEDARRKVEIAAKKYGKAGFAVAARGNPRELRERGYGILNLGSDVVSLGQAFHSYHKEFQNNAETSKAYYDNAP